MSAVSPVFARALALALGAAGMAALTACADDAPDRLAGFGDRVETGAQSGAQTGAGMPAALSGVDEAPGAAQFSYDGALTQGGFIRGSAPAGAVLARLDDQDILLGEEGAFFAAFDRDSPARVTLSATLANGAVITETLELTAREWQIERVNVARRKLRDPEAYWRAREPEHSAIVAARARETDAAGWQQDFIWPVKGRISGRFGRQRIYRGEPGSYHSGIDIAQPTGTPFVAPADGVVVLARTGFSLEGGLIIIDHGAGLNSAYLHAAKIHVEEGQSVRQGEHIGDVGSTGRSTGPHLHWGLKWHDARFDPILLAGPMG